MFKFVDSADLDLVTGSTCYARWLRVLGQELSLLNLVCFEVECDEGVFMVRAIRADEDGASSKGQLGESVRKAWHSLSGKNPQEADDDPVLSYSVDDLKEFEKHWIAKRTNVPGTPDIYSLGEMLRTVGRFVDARGARLLKICKEPRKILVHFQEKNGSDQQEEFLGLSLYKQQKDLNSARREPTDAWKDIVD